MQSTALRTTLLLCTTWLGTDCFFIISMYPFIIGVNVMSSMACTHHTTSMHYLARFSHCLPHWYVCNVLNCLYAPQNIEHVFSVRACFKNCSPKYSAVSFHSELLARWLSECLPDICTHIIAQTQTHTNISRMKTGFISLKFFAWV